MIVKRQWKNRKLKSKLAIPADGGVVTAPRVSCK